VGPRHPRSNISIRHAIEQWLDVVVLEDTTRERYEDVIRLYVMPTFGTLPAARLDAELVERFYARVHRCGRCAPVGPEVATPADRSAAARRGRSTTSSAEY
jgi:hypothetical protein